MRLERGRDHAATLEESRAIADQAIAALEDEPEPKSVALVTGRSARYIQEAFDTVILGTNFVGVPPTLEVFLVPGLLTAVTVHAPIGGTDSLPVPLGIISFDERVVLRSSLARPCHETSSP
jgi:hypothetical protein